MRAVLGIDAAWTEKNPSGVALLVERGARWTWAAVAPSAAAFVRGGEIPWGPGESSALDPEALLGACRAHLGGADVDVVAIDMPISLEPFSGRREADRGISREFGHAKCAVHSPTASRPGRVGVAISEGFVRAGFAIAAADCPPGAKRRLIEVYPHVALLELLQVGERHKYKVSRASKLWPGDPRARPKKVREGLEQILRGFALADPVMVGDPVPLPRGEQVGSLGSLKPFEDAIDAMVCAWVGARFLDGRATPRGDTTAAIWVPQASAS